MLGDIIADSRATSPGIRKARWTVDKALFGAAGGSFKLAREWCKVIVTNNG
jgi:hypothetical protein